jgi:diguanylate cyclase (GGDEF)-like protein/PAS domain S-box-containing protein
VWQHRALFCASADPREAILQPKQENVFMDEQPHTEARRPNYLPGTPHQPQFDEFTMLAAALCQTPRATITLSEETRRWFNAAPGLSFPETAPAHETLLCAEAIRQKKLLIIPDTELDPEFAGMAQPTDAPPVRFYAGAPLITEEGVVLGTLAVMDQVPGMLSPEQQEGLIQLSRDVTLHLDMRRQIARLEKLINEKNIAEEMLRRAYQDLQNRAPEQYAAVRRANAVLQAEIDERIKEANLSQTFINSLPGVFYVLDQQGKFLRWNKNFETVTGYSHEEIERAHPLDLFAGATDKATIADAIAKVYAEGSAVAEAALLTKGGKNIPYYINGTRIELDGKYCVCGMGIDITERRLSEETLRLRNRAIEASVNAIIITDVEGRIEYANPAFERMTGYRLPEALGRHFKFLHADDVDQPGLAAGGGPRRPPPEGGALLRNYRQDGQMFWNDFHIAPVRNPEGAVTHFVGVLNDITDIKRYEEQLEHQANYDALTQLANRNVLKDRIRHAISLAQRHGTGVTIGFMDLDNFKLVNDSLGHTTGDELLKSVARRLTACLRGQDTIARYGGDEFAFVLIDSGNPENVGILMERILKTVERPFNIDGHKFFISCSIGISFYPKDGADAETLLKHADTAMYRAKENGRNNFQFYTPSMNEQVTERLSLESKLRQALANDEFVLHYQPKVNLLSGRIVGIEALLRWRLSDNETVSPATFIPLAEETGLIVPIGEWVLHTACMHNKALQGLGLPPIGVAVNISARQFGPKTLGASISQVLDATGLDSQYLELELTESLVMQNPEEVIRVLGELRKMGLRLAIDDFGTGYSSLSYLQRFPVDRLKIDQSFVRDIGADPNDAIIARAVISLGHSLGLSVIAEGVSNEEQLLFLRDNGCDEMQGYLYSPPLPFADLTTLLQEKHALSPH